jgi:hypothetical protein
MQVLEEDLEPWGIRLVIRVAVDGLVRLVRLRPLVWTLDRGAVRLVGGPIPCGFELVVTHGGTDIDRRSVSRSSPHGGA